MLNINHQDRNKKSQEEELHQRDQKILELKNKVKLLTDELAKLKQDHAAVCNKSSFTIDELEHKNAKHKKDITGHLSKINEQKFAIGKLEENGQNCQLENNELCDKLKMA